VKLVAYSVFAWRGSLTLDKAILTDTIAYAIAYVLMRIAYNRLTAGTREGPKFRPDSTEKKRLLRYGLLNNFNDVGTLMLSTSADAFFVAAFLNPFSVGVYAFYSRLHEMLFNVLPGHLFDNVIQPMFFAMQPSEADQRAPRYFSLLVDMNLVLWWPVLAYATSYHHEIVQVVFGGKFMEYSWLLPISLLFGTQNVMSSPATFVAQYEERAGIILLSKVFAIYNVVALLVLVPAAGVYGAAIASGTSQLFKNLFVWWHVRHRARWLQGGLAFASALILWGGVLAACYALKAWVHAPPLVHLLLGAAICGLAILVHLRSPAISASDRALLAGVLSGKESRILRMLGLLESMPGNNSGPLRDGGG
jgi:O-antigen/teichoic acid export membrane protein